MDIGATHFSRVEFATEHNIPFARDIASLARTAVIQKAFPVVQTANSAEFRPKQDQEQGFVVDPLVSNPGVGYGHGSVEETPSKDVSTRSTLFMELLALEQVQQRVGLH